jgi:hypothetical protein
LTGRCNIFVNKWGASKLSIYGPAGSLKISVADAFNLLIYPRLKDRRLLLQFSRAIAMDRRLSNAPPGADHCDLLNWSNSWMKSIALERAFLLTFFACRKKVSRLVGMPIEKLHGCR